MRAIGWNIWKGFACFSSSARLGTLACSQESTQQYPKSHQLRIKEVGRSAWACNYSVELFVLLELFNESTPTMRKYIKDNGAAGYPGSNRDHW